MEIIGTIEDDNTLLQVAKVVDGTEESIKLEFLFGGPKITTVKKIRLETIGIEVPIKGEMSEFEYYKLLSLLGRDGGINIDTDSDKSIEKFYLLEGDKPVTNISFLQAREGITELSYITNKDARGKGYATRALGIVSDYIFKEKKVPFIVLNTINSASEKVAKKAGFKEEEVPGIDGYLYVKHNPYQKNDEKPKDK